MFLDSWSGKQVITGRQRRIGNDFRHQRGSGGQGSHIGSLYVLVEGQLRHPRSSWRGTQGHTAPVGAYAESTRHNEASNGRCGG